MNESQLTHSRPVGRRPGSENAVGRWWHDLSRAQRMLVVLAGVVVLLGIVVGVVMAWLGNSTETSTPGYQLSNRNPDALAVESPEEPRNNISPLTGELITESQYQELVARKPLVVMIENHPDARPQSGLDQADLVYETLVEGGITRFVGVFLSRKPEIIGPVRSLRKYFLDLAAGLDDPIIMHIGGAVSDNPEANALAEIQKFGVKSLGVNGGSFWRVGYRAAPHNAYSNTNELWAQAGEIGWTGPVSIKAWNYKDPANEIDDVSVNRVQVNWGAWGENLWSVVWEFDTDKNIYNRFHLSEAHVDAVTQKQLTARNVIVVRAPQYAANDGTARIVYDVIGQGKAEIFRDGQVIVGTWLKPSRTDQFRFEDSEGQEIVLNRGPSWVMVVPVESEVTY